MKRTNAVFAGKETLREEGARALQPRGSREQRIRSCLVSSLTLSLLHPFSKHFLDQLLCSDTRCCSPLATSCNATESNLAPSSL